MTLIEHKTITVFHVTDNFAPWTWPQVQTWQLPLMGPRLLQQWGNCSWSLDNSQIFWLYQWLTSNSVKINISINEIKCLNSIQLLDYPINLYVIK